LDRDAFAEVKADRMHSMYSAWDEGDSEDIDRKVACVDHTSAVEVDVAFVAGTVRMMKSCLLGEAARGKEKQE